MNIINYRINTFQHYRIITHSLFFYDKHSYTYIFCCGLFSLSLLRKTVYDRCSCHAQKEEKERRRQR